MINPPTISDYITQIEDVKGIIAEQEAQLRRLEKDLVKELSMLHPSCKTSYLSPNGEEVDRFYVSTRGGVYQIEVRPRFKDPVTITPVTVVSVA